MGDPIMTSRIVLTYEDYAALPNDGKRYELHEGELSPMAAPSARHQLIIGNLYVILRAHMHASGRGLLFLSPFDCIMSDITVVQPDLVYVDETRRRLLSERALEGAPTLAIEVLSPWSRHIDRRVKMTLYAKHAVDSYWIVDGDALTIDAYRLKGDGYHLDSRLEGTAPRALPPFPDFLLDPAAIWP
jgi:Uma2 family endonuclease